MNLSLPISSAGGTFAAVLIAGIAPFAAAQTASHTARQVVHLSVQPVTSVSLLESSPPSPAAGRTPAGFSVLTTRRVLQVTASVAGPSSTETSPLEVTVDGDERADSEDGSLWQPLSADRSAIRLFQRGGASSEAGLARLRFRIRRSPGTPRAASRMVLVTVTE